MKNFMKILTAALAAAICAFCFTGCAQKSKFVPINFTFGNGYTVEFYAAYRYDGEVINLPDGHKMDKDDPFNSIGMLWLIKKGDVLAGWMYDCNYGYDTNQKGVKEGVYAQYEKDRKGLYFQSDLLIPVCLIDAACSGEGISAVMDGTALTRLTELENEVNKPENEYTFYFFGNSAIRDTEVSNIDVINIAINGITDV